MRNAINVLAIVITFVVAGLVFGQAMNCTPVEKAGIKSAVEIANDCLKDPVCSDLVLKETVKRRSDGGIRD